jgi:hypothetical protein
MLSLAASRSKTSSALPSDPNIRLGLGETAAKRSFFFACGVLANVYFWPLASFRCRAAIRVLSGRSGRWAGFTPSLGSLSRGRLVFLPVPAASFSFALDRVIAWLMLAGCNSSSHSWPSPSRP